MQSEVPPGFEVIPTFSSSGDVQLSSILTENDLISIKAWCHSATAVRIVLFPTPGPLVSTTIFVGTQPISNAGHPHTLEHLIFLGSKKYPNRGYLENLACRCIASGTNAWTNDEYTAYTTTTAGEEGSMHLIPVFLDHVMRPIINDTGFTSEVYYKREDGTEAGVVFCEMQAREQTEDDLSEEAFRNSLLEGTPLAYNAGGLCEEIRKLTKEDIVDFHSSQYTGANVTVVVGGNSIQSSVLLSSLKPLLDEMASAPNFSPGKPQWLNDLVLKPLPTISRREVRFPCPDEDIGTVIMGWRGPGASDRLTNLALDIFLRYLCGDPWSPLRQILVEKKDQDASDIYYYYSVYSNVSIFSLSFTGVKYLSSEEDDDDEDEDSDESDLEEDDESDEDESEDHEMESKEDKEKNSHLKSGFVEKQVIGFIKEIIQKQALPNGLEAIHSAIDMEKKEWQFELESNAHETVPSHLIGEILFGDQKNIPLGETALTFLKRCDVLKSQKASYWLSLLEKYFLKNPHVEIVMVPDVDLAEEANHDGKPEEQKEGTSDKSKETTDIVTKLATFKSTEFPPIPNIMNVSRFQYTTDLKHGDQFISQNISLETKFVHCTIFFDVSDLNVRDRILVPFICELMPTCDVRLGDGSKISYVENSRAIAEATIDTENSGTFLGFKDDLARQCVGCHFAASPTAVAESIDLVLRTIFCAEVTEERVAAIAQTFFSDAKTNMRDGEMMLAAASELIPYQNILKKLNPHVPTHIFSNFLGTFPLLSLLKKTFVEKNATGKSQRKKLMSCLTTSMNAIRKIQSRKIMVQITAKDPTTVQESFSEFWKKYRLPFESSRRKPVDEPTMKPTLPISRRIPQSLANLLENKDIGKIIGISGIESSYLNVIVDSAIYPGHGDWASLRVLIEMLCKMDGPLTNAIRGSGLAYGVGIMNYHWKGHFVASISESSSPVKAWDALCSSLRKFREKMQSELDASSMSFDLDTAKAATLYALNLSRSTPESIASGTVGRTALGAPASPAADQELEKAVEKVSVSDLISTYDAHVEKLFKPSGRLTVVTCPCSIVDTLARDFRQCDIPLNLEQSTKESLLPKAISDITSFVRN